MQNKKSILDNLSNRISNVDASLPHNKIVKEIDKIVQESYIELYNLHDSKFRQEVCQDKKGHCC